ncbi:MAG: acetyl-CoA carboxylase, biotin carboxyl carrier protein [Holosporales bacterium]|jgi:acetyl-CoA carboxylase biotin carboxyl carrier protein|nr:acetyl-CoA carboxylase, biotin carboxyl carrier protein [Holosporales bacterium]
MASFKINEAVFDKLANILKKHQLGEVEYQDSNFKIRIAARNTMMQRGEAYTEKIPEVADPSTTISVPTDDWTRHSGALKSPMVGVCYLAPEPGAKNFVEIGSEVSEGQPILILEAMKVMNLIKAHKSGKVVHIAVKSSDPIEYGQLLLVIE